MRLVEVQQGRREHLVAGLALVAAPHAPEHNALPANGQIDVLGQLLRESDRLANGAAGRAELGLRELDLELQIVVVLLEVHDLHVEWVKDGELAHWLRSMAESMAASALSSTKSTSISGSMA
ncbi:hypothetical protein D3C78_1675040 [compost metagenome]